MSSAFDSGITRRQALVGTATFVADYRPSYDAAAAMDGWKRCTEHFTKFLKA